MISKNCKEGLHYEEVLCSSSLPGYACLALVACGQKYPTPDTPDTPDDPQTKVEYKVAMITDYGDITDQSFNQTTYEACKAFAEDNSIEFSYFKPAGDNTADRVAMIEKAVDEGFNVIVMPGYAFGGAIVEAAPEFPDVKFIALDVAAGDLLETAVAKAGETYDYTPENWDLNKYVDMSNVYCAVYQEELCGYMAGYAAVKLGYKNLGFLGGMSVPAVVRYGYGFVQGVDAAAADLGLTDVKVNYIYGGQFFGDADITAVMDTWYQGGTEVVFACGGGIYTSAVDAAKKVGAKVIGVDVDQAGVIAKLCRRGRHDRHLRHEGPLSRDLRHPHRRYRQRQLGQVRRQDRNAGPRLRRPIPRRTTSRSPWATAPSGPTASRRTTTRPW